jgi:hypothetical protein
MHSWPLLALLLSTAPLASGLKPLPNQPQRATRPLRPKAVTTKKPVKVYTVLIPQRAPPKKSPAAPSPDRGVVAPMAPQRTVGTPYWYDPRIHNWGNIGLGGRLHAFFAPLATAIIDATSYGGVDVRKKVHEMLPAGQTVLDLCCGVGFSTAPGADGVDTSQEMCGVVGRTSLLPIHTAAQNSPGRSHASRRLDMARLRRPDSKFYFGNGETFGNPNSYDIVTVMVRARPLHTEVPPDSSA